MDEQIKAVLTVNENTTNGTWEIRFGKTGELIATCPSRKRAEQVAVSLTFFRKATGTKGTSAQ
jgi:hypothetical protein